MSARSAGTGTLENKNFNRRLSESGGSGAGVLCRRTQTIAGMRTPPSSAPRRTLGGVAGMDDAGPAQGVDWPRRRDC